MSTATAPPNLIASRDRSKSLRVGARRFTQTAHASVHSDAHKGAGKNSAWHGRRYSSIAREPSAATITREASHRGEIFEEDIDIRDAKRLANHDTRMLLVSLNSLLGRDGGGKAVENLIVFVLQGGFNQVLEEITGKRV
jgi:hypothetical protein